jgi:hypothetical protein
MKPCVCGHGKTFHRETITPGQIGCVIRGCQCPRYISPQGKPPAEPRAQEESDCPEIEATLP